MVDGYIVYLPAQTPSPPTTMGPGSVIIIHGNNRSVDNQLPGTRQDASDMYGIFVALLAIAVAILATRLIFGRGLRSRPPGSRPAPPSSPVAPPTPEPGS